MNFPGKFEQDSSLSHFGMHADLGSLSLDGHANTVTIPNGHLLFSGDYERSGLDLIVSDHDHRVVIHDYFRGEQRPTLVSPEGAALDPSASWAIVRSPLTAARATFALKAGEWFRRGRLLMVSPVHGDYRRCQSEIPLIVLFRFPGPALKRRSTATAFNRAGLRQVERRPRAARPCRIPVLSHWELQVSPRNARLMRINALFLLLC